ncbi:hypothetical protein ERO13_A11G297426v2 [Gossypium hirsutum]|nr:hypothetical protein ERO13_A11G297426v2 [Gossypium hirsutum]
MSLLLSTSSSISRKKYDVFLSFRGEDTRKSFTDHLYDALNRTGIVTFRDDPKLEAGEDRTGTLESNSAIMVLGNRFFRDLCPFWLVLGGACGDC